MPEPGFYWVIYQGRKQVAELGEDGAWWLTAEAEDVPAAEVRVISARLLPPT